MSATDARATLLGMQQPTMFAHDGTTIFYPTAPGRVYMIAIAALADCDGSDEDLSDSTASGCLGHLVSAANRNAIHSCAVTPVAWPRVHYEVGGDIINDYDIDATVDDFHDALEQWADWCDRDSARLDSLDGVLAAVAAA